MKRASPRLPVLAAGRIGGVLGVLLLAGCAGIERSPQREAPPAAPPRATAAAEPHVAATASPAGPPPSAPSADRGAPGATEQKTSKPAAPTAQAPATAAAKSPEKSPAIAPPKLAPSPPPAARAPKPQTPAPVLAKPEGPPPLDLKSLEARLKETKAIGVFTKLTLKNQIDELLDRFRAYYQGRLQTSLAELRRSFDLLVLKTVALLQDADPPLASAIVSSRESIWRILSNPATFATG